MRCRWLFLRSVVPQFIPEIRDASDADRSVRVEGATRSAGTLVNFYVKLIYHSKFGFDSATKGIALDVDAKSPQKSPIDLYW